MIQELTRSAQLPPLILHPFSGGAGADDLLDGSLASLALQGLVKSADEEADLMRRMLAGRFQEVRMLIFLGKDVFRWLQQCSEHVLRPEYSSEFNALEKSQLNERSFASLLVDAPPPAVEQKLLGWGVTDRKSIFSRAIGIHSIFENPPALETLSPIFLKNYHRYADHAYICYQHAQAFLPLSGSAYHFEIFASDEYARVISEGWNLD